MYIYWDTCKENNISWNFKQLVEHACWNIISILNYLKKNQLIQVISLNWLNVSDSIYEINNYSGKIKDEENDLKLKIKILKFSMLPNCFI